MSNKEIISNTICKWIGQVAGAVVPQIKLPQSNVTMFMSNILGIDLSNYSILKELSFLVPDLVGVPVKRQVESMVDKMGLRDDDLPEYFTRIVESCINQTDSTDEPINIYGIEFEKKSFEKLMDIYKETKKSK